MVAQAGQVAERESGAVDPSSIGQQVAENDRNEDTARWAAVERRLDQADRARMESEARMAQMMGQMMKMLNAVPPAAMAKAALTHTRVNLGGSSNVAIHVDRAAC